MNHRFASRISIVLRPLPPAATARRRLRVEFAAEPATPVPLVPNCNPTWMALPFGAQESVSLSA